MATSPITATNSIYTPTESNPRVPEKTMGQDDFLKLLVTQFTNQDPMSPMKDTEYIAQMAQFTSLEQTKTMSSEIAKLRADSQLTQSNSLIGRTVELQPDPSNQDIRLIGTVSAVTITAGTPQIVVNNTPYDLSTVLSIRPTAAQ
jgi:flagellar basal-body rod modification protein FlgD